MDQEAGTETEIWRPVPVELFAPFYEISSHGRVRSQDRLMKASTGTEYIHKGRLITPKKTGSYLGVGLFLDNYSERHYLHRLVAKAFIENPEHKPCVNHIDFNRSNNHVSNLEWVTYRENTEHCKKAGRIICKPVKGSKNGNAVINEETVAYIREVWRPGQTKELARKYSLSYAAIRFIVIGRTWKHVDPPRAIAYTCVREGNDCDSLCSIL